MVLSAGRLVVLTAAHEDSTDTASLETLRKWSLTTAGSARRASRASRREAVDRYVGGGKRSPAPSARRSWRKGGGSETKHAPEGPPGKVQVKAGNDEDRRGAARIKYSVSKREEVSALKKLGGRGAGRGGV